MKSYQFHYRAGMVLHCSIQVSWNKNFANDILRKKSNPFIWHICLDEFPKHGTTPESLSKLKPCFDKNGSVTPGNASGLNDSSAAVLLMSQAAAQKSGATPLARIVAFGQGGVDPTIMGMGASAAVEAVVSFKSFKLDYCISVESMMTLFFSYSLKKPAGRKKKWTYTN